MMSPAKRIASINVNGKQVGSFKGGSYVPLLIVILAMLNLMLDIGINDVRST